MPSLLLVACVAVLPLLAYQDGPLPAHTGAFGEPSCHACHFDHDVDAPGGSLAIAGVPDRYTPGASYRVTVTIEREGIGSAGFQLAARFIEGDPPGRQAGELRPLDDRTQLARSETPVRFAQHTLAGTKPTGSVARWTVEWSAPGAPAGPVAFDVVANAANGDRSEFGDYIYRRRAVAKSP